MEDVHVIQQVILIWWMILIKYLSRKYCNEEVLLSMC